MLELKISARLGRLFATRSTRVAKTFRIDPGRARASERSRCRWRSRPHQRRSVGLLLRFKERRKRQHRVRRRIEGKRRCAISAKRSLRVKSFSSATYQKRETRKSCAASFGPHISAKNSVTHPRWKTLHRWMKSNARLGRARSPVRAMLAEDGVRGNGAHGTTRPTLLAGRMEQAAYRFGLRELVVKRHRMLRRQHVHRNLTFLQKVQRLARYV